MRYGKALGKEDLREEAAEAGSTPTQAETGEQELSQAIAAPAVGLPYL